MAELLERDAAAFDARQAGGLRGTSHPSQVGGKPENLYWQFRRLGSPHERSVAPRRPLCIPRARVVQDACSAVAAALHIPPYGATAFVAARLGARKQAVRKWAADGLGARLFVAALADLVESIEETSDVQVGSAAT